MTITTRRMTAALAGPAAPSSRLTRAGQVNLAQPRAQAQSTPTSCIGH